MARTYVAENFLMRHGENEFSLWTVELSSADVEQLLKSSRLYARGDLETSMGAISADAEEGCKAHLLFCDNEGKYSLYTCTVNEDFGAAYQDKGVSVRGTMKDIILEVASVLQVETAEAKELQP